MNINTVAIIVAGGVGSRLDNNYPKQYLKIGKISILKQSIIKFLNNQNIDRVLVVINKDHLHLYQNEVKDLNLLPVVFGGNTRSKSVKNGIDSIRYLSPKNVLIHDAVRPFVTDQIINKIILGLDTEKAIIPAIGVEDTIKEVVEHKVTRTLNRNNLYHIQTPQGFNYSEIINAYNNCDNYNMMTDEASIFEQLGYDVKIINGDKINFKITTIEDYMSAKYLYFSSNNLDGGINNKTDSANMENNINKETAINKANNIANIDNNNMNEGNNLMQHANIVASNIVASYVNKVGFGFDVHAYKKTDKECEIILGATKVKSKYKIIAHSDGDLVLHALVDAILGAIGKGDIGDYFPPTNAKFKNMNSQIFLEKALDLLKEQSAIINNIDVTIACQEPKLWEYKQLMKKNLAKIINIEENLINIKATTTEKLGFIGRKEGIATFVTISVNTPSINSR